MLDIFEFALNIFNFTYVRLDGSTKVLIFALFLKFILFTKNQA